MSDLWKELQDLEWEMYKQSPVGVFSIEGLRGADVTGEVLSEYIPNGVCLDVGCGALASPYYMSIARDVTFSGIDPYEGDVERNFTFTQGYAESLPFDSCCFDGVLFATSIDHLKKPEVALEEAGRVLKADGFLFIWITLRAEDAQYFKWQNAPKPAKYDEYHLWAFTHDTLTKAAKGFNVVEARYIEKTGNQYVYVFKKKL